MFRFPFYSYPYYYPYNRYYSKNNYSNTKLTQDEENNKNRKNSITNPDEISNTINSRFSPDSEEPIFEMLGIKLYFDDLIILGVLFFLYQQNVTDEMLYIILFLLLFG